MVAERNLPEGINLPRSLAQNPTGRRVNGAQASLALTAALLFATRCW